MSDNKEIAKKVARILRTLARKVEENPDLLKDMELSLGDIPAVKRKEKELPINFDIFQIFAEGGEMALRQKLETFDLRTLKRIIRQHGFDPSKLAEKWRKKERILSLIIERVSARSDKGKVFKEYP
jgi:hypothetical protein